MSKKSKYAFIESSVSTLVNILLFAFKLVIGTSIGSVALIADAWHTLSDSISSVAVFVGVKLSKRPADDEHPYGHGRIEMITSIFVAIFLGYVGFNFLSKSIMKFIYHESVSFTKAAIYVTIISILAKEILAQLSFYLSKKTDSLLLKADGWHHRSDAISSIIILIGIFLNKYIWWIDSVLGVIVSFIIFYMAFEILSSSINPLLGEKPDLELEKQLQELICKDKMLSFHHFHLHNYGSHKEITFHIKLDPEMKLKDAHKIADCIENQIRDKFKIEATIHVEPEK